MADEPKKYSRKSKAAKKREHDKGPTLRQSRLAKEIAKGRNLKEAAIAAGYPAKARVTIRAPGTTRRSYASARNVRQGRLFSSCAH
jgi:hypothetical protein